MKLILFPILWKNRSIAMPFVWQTGQIGRGNLQSRKLLTGKLNKLGFMKATENLEYLILTKMYKRLVYQVEPP